MTNRYTVLPYDDNQDRSYVCISMYDFDMTFDRRSDDAITIESIGYYADDSDVPCCCIRPQKSTRNLVIEYLIQKVTGVHFKAYDDVYARSALTVATNTSKHCGVVYVESNRTYIIVLPDKRLFSNYVYYLTIFEIVYLALTVTHKIKFGRNTNAALVYSINALAQLGMLDINTEFKAHEDPECRYKHHFNFLCERPLYVLDIMPMTRINWPEAVYRYYRRFKTVLGQKYNADPSYLLDEDAYVKPEWCFNEIVNEYANLASTVVKVYQHSRNSVTARFLDAHQTKYDTSLLSKACMAIFATRMRIDVYNSLYTFIEGRINRSRGHVQSGDSKRAVFFGAAIDPSKNSVYNTIVSMCVLYHEIGHLIFPPAMPRKGVASRRCHDPESRPRGSNNAEYQASRFGVWCTIMNGISATAIYEVLSTTKHAPPVIKRYTRFLYSLDKRGIKLSVPRDMKHMFRRVD